MTIGRGTENGIKHLHRYECANNFAFARLIRCCVCARSGALAINYIRILSMTVSSEIITCDVFNEHGGGRERARARASVLAIEVQNKLDGTGTLELYEHSSVEQYPFLNATEVDRFGWVFCAHSRSHSYFDLHSLRYCVSTLMLSRMICTHSAAVYKLKTNHQLCHSNAYPFVFTTSLFLFSPLPRRRVEQNVCART